MAILEKEACAAKDLKEANKIKRYGLRNQIEKHYQNKDYEGEVKTKHILDNKYSYKRYNVPENRGYDIVNMEKINKTQMENKKLKHNISDWETICKNSNAGLKANYTTYNDSSSKDKNNFVNTTAKGNLIIFPYENFLNFF